MGRFYSYKAADDVFACKHKTCCCRMNETLKIDGANGKVTISRKNFAVAFNIAQ